jgi:hypothetical protein
MFSSERLDRLFIKACEAGHLPTVAELYEDFYLRPNSLLRKFASFLFIFDHSYPKLNPHAYNNEAFVKACENGNHNVVNFLLNNKKFVNEISQTDGLSKGFNYAISLGYVDMAKTIMHFINTKQKDLNSFYHNFNQCFEIACKYGQAKSVDYILQNFPESLQIKLGKEKTAISLISYGFMSACEYGKRNVIDSFIKNPLLLSTADLRFGLAIAIEKNQLNMVKYIMNAPILKKNINIGRMPKVKVPNVEMMQYLMYGLNLKDSPNIMSKFTCDFNISLAEKMELHKELSSEINSGNTSEEKPKKKLKL